MRMFEEPKLELLKFGVEDVITASEVPEETTEPEETLPDLATVPCI